MKAVGLFSGGLDSALAIKLIQEQGIEVIALNFVGPFCTCVGKGCSIANLAKKLGVEIKLMNKGEDYLKIVRKPKYGYGKNINPCIDCKIYILKKAKQYAKEIGAKFVFTGEVLGQRPMSQHYRTLMLIEKEAGLKGKVVRPLCAKLLKLTEAEKNGWIDREKLLKFEGRTRTPQIDLAKKFRIEGFMCGGSGCRLTNYEYAKKLNDLFSNKKRIGIKDIKLLNFGRHFRIGKNKIVVGRNKEDNEQILLLKADSDIVLESKNAPGPITIISEKPSKKTIEIGAAITLRYSDCDKDEDIIEYWKGKKSKKQVMAKKMNDQEIERMRL